MDKLKEYIELIMAKFGDKKEIIIGGLIIIGFILFASALMAQPNQDHTCQGGHNCNGGGDDSGQLQGQAQGQQQGQAQQTTVTQSSSTDISNNIGVENDTRVSVNAGAFSDSSGNSVDVSGGQSTSSSQSGGGSAQSTSGGSVSAVNFEDSAASAASIFAGHCNSGASGQVSGGGFSVVNGQQFCDYIRMADAMWLAYQRETSACYCEGVCSPQLASVEMICLDGEQAQKFLGAYRENLWDAHDLLQATSGTATVGRVTGQVITPMALLLALVLL